MELKGITAIITGSTGKLGFEIAIGLAKAGANCLCHYNSNTERAEQLKSEIQSIGRACQLVQSDLIGSTGLKKIFDVSIAETARLLINSAAIFYKTPADNTDQAAIDRIFQLNTVAPLLLSTRFARNLRKRSVHGKIINIADVAAKLRWKKYSAYCASKAALIAQTVSLAKELAPDITVNVVSPGIIEGMETDEELEQVKRVPLARSARPSEVVEAILFLIKNDYMTGQNINVAGGREL